MGSSAAAACPSLDADELLSHRLAPRQSARAAPAACALRPARSPRPRSPPETRVPGAAAADDPLPDRHASLAPWLLIVWHRRMVVAVVPVAEQAADRVPEPVHVIPLVKLPTVHDPLCGGRSMAEHGGEPQHHHSWSRSSVMTRTAPTPQSPARSRTGSTPVSIPTGCAWSGSP